MLSVLAAGLLITSSCTKTGPQGPQGPTGNANVIGEDPFTTYSTDWTPSVPAGTWYVTYPDSHITTDVFNYGEVEIYKSYGSIGWTNLPDIDGNVITVYNFVPGSFTISVLTTDNTIPANPGNVSFRALIIPSSVRLANPTTNWKKYNEAVAALNKAKLQVSVN